MSTAKDKGARPWTRSAAGVLLGINFPWMDGLEYRPMAHVFELAEGGLAWADHGWSYPMNPGHPFHVERGLVLPGGPPWYVELARDHRRHPDDDNLAVIRVMAGERPDGTRAGARARIEEHLAVRLAPDRE